MAQERLHWTDEGQVRLELRRPCADGTTQPLFDPVELLERLAALTPRPRVFLILYHGVACAPCRVAGAGGSTRDHGQPRLVDIPASGQLVGQLSRRGSDQSRLFPDSLVPTDSSSIGKLFAYPTVRSRSTPAGGAVIAPVRRTLEPVHERLFSNRWFAEAAHCLLAMARPRHAPLVCFGY